jgi:hypothetical protein
MSGYSIPFLPLYRLSSTAESTDGGNSTKQKALLITSEYEGPDGYSNVTGNFDGQGLSFGALQWNLGQGTLQPILSSLITRYPDTVNAIFGGDKLQTLQNVLATSSSEQVDWGQSISLHGGGTIQSDWCQAFKHLGQTAQCQTVQLEAADAYLQRAKALCDEFGIRTERGYALMFDIAVQNGSVSDAARTYMDQQGGTDIAEKEKLSLIAQAVANASAAAYRNDVLARKMAIVNGSGVVHDTYFDFDGKAGLSDRLINLDGSDANAYAVLIDQSVYDYYQSLLPAGDGNSAWARSILDRSRLVVSQEQASPSGDDENSIVVLITEAQFDYLSGLLGNNDGNKAWAEAQLARSIVGIEEEQWYYYTGLIAKKDGNAEWAKSQIQRYNSNYMIVVKEPQYEYYKSLLEHNDGNREWALHRLRHKMIVAS